MILGKQFENGNYQYSINGNVEENDDSLIIDDSEEITFAECNLKALYENLKTETKAPIFYFTSLDNDSLVSYTVYNKAHRTVSYRITVGDTYVYVSQKKQIEGTSNGAVNKKELVQELELSRLNTKTDIYQSTQDESFYCSFVYDNNVLTIVSNMNLEDYKIMVEGIEYR